MRWNRVGLCWAILAASPVAQGVVFVARVGDDAACGFRTSVLPNALQAAIDAVPTTVPPGDLYIVRVARTGAYVGTRVLIEDRTLRVEGGFATCASIAADATNTTIDATGAAGGPVRVRGTTAQEQVTLARLTLRGGSGAFGSGVSVANAGVTLDRVSATANSSNRGGGVEVTGGGLGASAHLIGATRVFANDAMFHGGGVYCGNGAELTIESTVAVSSNSALNGGGLYLDGCSGYANSGAAGIGGLLVNLGFNEAERNGGGIFADSSAGPTDFTIGYALAADDPAPLLVSNVADLQGGAVFAVGGDVRLAIIDALIDNNSSVFSGGAIRASGAGVRVEVRRDRRVCPLGDRCSSISNNTSNNSGGGISASGGARVQVYGTYLEGNSATHASAVHVQDFNAQVELRNSVVAQNRDADSLFVVRDPAAIGPDFRARLVLDQTTVVRNLDATRVIDVNAPGTVRVAHSIVNESAAMPVFDRPAGYVPETECSMLHEIASAGSVDPLTVAFATPGFVDRSAGNYRIRATAEATDRCPIGADSDAIDFEFDPRPLDGPLPDLAGPYDVGFDEYNDRFFADGLESPD